MDEPINNPASNNINTILQTPPEPPVPSSPISPSLPPITPTPFTPPQSPDPSDTFVLKSQPPPKKTSPQVPGNLKKILPVAALVLLIIAAGAGAILIRQRYQKPKAEACPPGVSEGAFCSGNSGNRCHNNLCVPWYGCSSYETIYTGECYTDAQGRKMRLMKFKCKSCGMVNGGECGGDTYWYSQRQRSTDGTCSCEWEQPETCPENPTSPPASPSTTPISTPTPTPTIGCKNTCRPLPVGQTGGCRTGLSCIQVDPYHSECINPGCNYNDQTANCTCPGASTPTPTKIPCGSNCTGAVSDDVCEAGLTCYYNGVANVCAKLCTPGGVVYDDISPCDCTTPTPTPTLWHRPPTPTPTLTPVPGACGCTDIRLFRDDQEVQASQLSAGEEIRVSVWGAGTNQWKGRIKIYKGSGPNLLDPTICRTGNLISDWCETEQFATGVGYFIDITVPTGEGTYTIEGETCCGSTSSCNWK